jgi:hypothetical protein
LSSAVVVDRMAAWMAQWERRDFCAMPVQNQIFIGLVASVSLGTGISHTYQSQQRYLTNAIDFGIIGPMQTVLHLLIPNFPEMRIISTGGDPLLKELKIINLLPAILKYFLFSGEPIAGLPKGHANVFDNAAYPPLPFRVSKR